MDTIVALDVSVEDISQPVWELVDDELLTIRCNRFDSCGSGSCAFLFCDTNLCNPYE
jgi:hypothetical protein